MATLIKLADFGSTNGSYPSANLTIDSAGDLFGVTAQGGTNGLGTVFELQAGSHTLTTLASFTGGNGSAPHGNLVLDSAGDLFGAAQNGGANGDGALFELAAGSHTISALASFNQTNGAYPTGTLSTDAAGDLFGTTISGGSANLGTVYELAAGSHAVATLASFTVPNSSVVGGVAADKSGDLFGVARYAGPAGAGSIFEVAAGSHSVATLANFNNVNGTTPWYNPIVDASGNLFGTTENGGASGDGTVYELPAGSSAIVTLASFSGANGAMPMDNLLLDSAGDLFGTTNGGGTSGYGTVFEIAAGSHSITTLANLSASSGGAPYNGLVADSAGNLYGEGYMGGVSGVGTVFEITNSGYAPFHASTVVNLQGYNDTVAAPATVTPPTGFAGSNLLGPIFGNWNVAGPASNITITAQGYNNTIAAGGGYDTINAGLSNAAVKVSDGAGDVTVRGSVGNASVTLGSGDDTVSTGGYNNAITLGNGANSVTAGVGNATVQVGNGNNAITADGYSNRIVVGSGVNTINAGVGNDSVTVQGGTAAITAGGYNDNFTIQGGNVAISGIVGYASVTLGAGFGSGSIDFTGFTGNLVQTGGAWTLLKNGAVYATFVLPVGQAVQAASDGSGGTRITMVAAGSAPMTFPTITETSGNQTILLGAGTTRLNLWGYDNNVSSTLGGFTIGGDSGGSTFNLGQDGNTLILGGYGDTIDIGVDSHGHSVATGANSISGTAGDTTVVIGDGNQTITMGGYYNSVATGVGNSTINAGAGFDTVVVTGGDNTIAVTGNQNAITTGAGADIVTLGTGWNNTIHGGAGAATITGGYGNTYVTGIGTLNITDFNAPYNDVLDLTHTEALLGVTAAAFSGAIDGGDPHALDVFVTDTHSVTSLVAVLHGASGSLTSLVAAHSIHA